MRIVLVSEWFSEGMGYSENCLPKALASLGHEVHLITSNTQIYFDSPNYTKIYERFLGQGIVSCGVKQLDGYYLHRLPYFKFNSRKGIRGLWKKINEIKPEVVHSFDIINISSIILGFYKSFFNYKYFLETHIHASVFTKQKEKYNNVNSLKRLIQKKIGKFLSLQATKCYAISIDAMNVAINFYGIEPKKIGILPLGVDTSIFRPINNDKNLITSRVNIRENLGYSETDIVSIYSGRLSEDKNPLCLAKAINFIRSENQNYHGLFIGEGPQIEMIKTYQGCKVIPFMKYIELPDYYRAADIGVWPKQESTSQIDAVCCGLPIIISNKTQVPERVFDNGLLYEENDYHDLAKKLLFLEQKNVRQDLGISGSKRISVEFNWEKIASICLSDYSQ